MLAQALASGFAQTHVATKHPNVTGALALALGALALVVIGLARVLGRRRPVVGTAVAFGVPLVLLVAFQAIAFSRQRADAWWPRTVATVGDALGVDEFTPLGRRFLALREPVGQTGGRWVNWRVTRELIAVRPCLGFGLDAVHAVYRNEATFRTSTPLAHPHHGPLTLALQGGALLLVTGLGALARDVDGADVPVTGRRATVREK